jgi:protein tyrosine phosphatase (PTP) superfamily phosphohydrolase (DUF442 family)
MSLLAALNGVLNAREPLPGLATGGQPSAAHFAALKDAGCNVVVDTRDAMEEQPFDPSAVVRAAGLTYINIPVSHGPNEDRTYDAVRRTLRAVADSRQRAFVYCNSGNRVGAALLPYLMLDRGLEEDAAVTTAMQIGTRSAELIEEALAYVRRAEADRGGKGR